MSGRINQEKWVADFLLSEAPGYRSREAITAAAGNYPVGSLFTLTGAVATAANADCISLYPISSAQTDRRIAVIARDAEVTDAYINYGALDQTATNTRLLTRNIVVRQGVLAQAQVAPSADEMPPVEEEEEPPQPAPSQPPPQPAPSGRRP